VYVPRDRYDQFGPIQDSQIQPASLDVRLSDHFITHPEGARVFATNEFWTLQPGDCILGSIVERFRLADNEVARVEGKSSWARHFLTVHSAGFIDPGFHGDITLELKNDGHHEIELRPGAVIAQVSFQLLVAPAVRPYGSRGLNSHYQGQRNTTPSAL
jgi:dCTP deaminase